MVTIREIVVPAGIVLAICLGISMLLGAVLERNAVQPPLRPPGLVKVQIVEHCFNAQKQKWFLLQAEDGQRCPNKSYRGKGGDTFYAWPEDLTSYRQEK